MPAAPTLPPTTTTTLRFAVMRLARRLRQERVSATLTLTQHAALATLDRCGPMTPSELAGAERVQPPSMTRVIAALEELRLVSRVPHPSDRRQVLVSVTPAAHDMLEADRRARDELLARRLSILTPDELAALVAAAPVLAKLAEARD